MQAAFFDPDEEHELLRDLAILVRSRSEQLGEELVVREMRDRLHAKRVTRDFSTSATGSSRVFESANDARSLIGRDDFSMRRAEAGTAICRRDSPYEIGRVAKTVNRKMHDGARMRHRSLQHCAEAISAFASESG